MDRTYPHRSFGLIIIGVLCIFASQGDLSGKETGRPWTELFLVRIVVACRYSFGLNCWFLYGLMLAVCVACKV